MPSFFWIHSKIPAASKNAFPVLNSAFLLPFFESSKTRSILARAFKMKSNPNQPTDKVPFNSFPKQSAILVSPRGCEACRTDCSETLSLQQSAAQSIGTFRVRKRFKNLRSKYLMNAAHRKSLRERAANQVARDSSCCCSKVDAERRYGMADRGRPKQVHQDLCFCVMRIFRDVVATSVVVRCGTDGLDCESTESRFKALSVPQEIEYSPEVISLASWTSTYKSYLCKEDEYL